MTPELIDEICAHLEANPVEAWEADLDAPIPFWPVAS